MQHLHSPFTRSSTHGFTQIKENSKWCMNSRRTRSVAANAVFAEFLSQT